VTFIPDLLNASGVVNARNIGTNYVLLVGPSRTDRKPLRSVRHEYLHFLLDPLFSKYVAYLPEEGSFMKLVTAQPTALTIYRQNFKLMVTESLLQMVELRLDQQPDERQQAAVVAAYDQGLILAPYFWDCLCNFEKGTESLPEIFQTLIEEIRWEDESKRGESVAALRRRVESANARAEGSAAKTGARAETRSLLSEANRLLAAREFDKARGILEKVVQSDPGSASALFGLAQIASKEQSADRALELYEQAAANAGEETWIAAWSFVHRGNIYLALDEPEKARAEWTRVLGLRGDLRGAGEAARKSLDENAP
jgi:tetratricopeptide (TPR) repeat protein